MRAPIAVAIGLLAALGCGGEGGRQQTVAAQAPLPNAHPAPHASGSEPPETFAASGQPNGSACATGGVCDSGFCANGVCCDTACTDDCGACSLTGHVGTCSPKPSGTICRFVFEQCDVAEYCTGSSLACPDDVRKPNGTPCNDFDACTQTDTCQLEGCVGSNPVVCGGGDQCTYPNACDPATGACVPGIHAQDGIGCDDGNRCTDGDSCHAGTCLPGTTNTCTAPGQAKYANVVDLGSTWGFSNATSINNSGVVVGEDVPPAAGIYQNGYPGSHGFRWSQSEGRIDVPWAGAQSYADAINDAGVMSVSAGINPWELFPCRYDPAVDSLPVCQSSHGFSTGINAAGTVTGWIGQPGLRMFRLDAGSIEILPSVPNSGNTLDVYGSWIDADGSVVGVQVGYGGVRYTAARGTEVLANLLPAGSDWYLANPAFIRSGEIVGWGYHGGLQRAFRIKTTPTGDVASVATLPMPSTFAPDAPMLMAADSLNAVGEIVGTIWDSAATWPEAAFVYTDVVGAIDLNDLIDPDSGWTLRAAWGINNSHEVVGFGTRNGVNRAYKLTLPDLSACPTDSCHVAVRDPLTGICSSNTKPDGTACDDGDACTQGDVCNAGVCRGPTAFTCVAQDTCQDPGSCDPSRTSSQPPSTQDLVGWWKLDGNGLDASGGGHALAVEGNVTPAPGRIGLGMKFDGASCMTAPIWDEARMQGASGVTMMAWISPSDQFVCPLGPLAVVGRGNDYTVGAQCFGGEPGPAVTGTVRMAGAQTWGYPGGVGFSNPNAWTHVTVTWDHTNIAIFVNGRYAISYADPGDFTDIESTFAVGCMISYYFTGADRIMKFRGTVDDVMLYRRALSPAEIASYYAAVDPCAPHPTHPDGSSCTDFNLCTQTDSCQSGTCVGTNPIVCSADQCHTPGTCISYAGTCTPAAPKPDGTACSDGSACTRTDVCEAGACVGANPTVCLAPDSCHTASCDPSSGQCTSTTNAGTCNFGAFDYDKAGRLIRDRQAELHYDPYDQLREVVPIASPPPITNLPVEDLKTPNEVDETEALAGHSSAKGHVLVDVSLTSGAFRTLLFKGNGGPEDLNATLGLSSVFGNAMNDADAVTGSWLPAGGSTYSVFRYDQTGFHDLGNAGDSTSAYDINNANQVVGYFSVGGNAHGYRHSDATGFQEIGTFGGVQSWGWRIDDLGIVSASAQTPSTPAFGTARFGHAALYHDLIGLQDLNDLIDPMAGTTLVIANEKQGDWVVGVKMDGDVQRAYRLRLSTGALDDIGWAGWSSASSVNSAGDAVGWGYLEASNTTQVAWILSERTGLAKLNDLIDPASGWDLRVPSGIDDAGDVVGWGYHHGIVSAFRLRIPAHASGTSGPTVAEVHTYGYDGLRTSTTTAPGTANASTQVWFTQDYSEHDGKREHYVRIGNRIVAKLTLLPPPGGGGGGGMGLLLDPRHPPIDLGDLVAKILLAMLLASGLAATAAGLIGKKRRPAWVAITTGPALLFFIASCDKMGTNRRSAETVWQRIQTVYFHHGIAAGPVLTTNADGTLNEERRYEPFGQPVDANVGGTLGPVDFRREQQNSLNKLMNPNTGWSYHGARWMQPQTARWISPDPAVKGPQASMLAQPANLHPYQYVSHSPLLYWDPTGWDKTAVVFGVPDRLGISIYDDKKPDKKLKEWQFKGPESYKKLLGPAVSREHENKPVKDIKMMFIQGDADLAKKSASAAKDGPYDALDYVGHSVLDQPKLNPGDSAGEHGNITPEELRDAARLLKVKEVRIYGCNAMSNGFATELKRLAPDLEVKARSNYQPFTIGTKDGGRHLNLDLSGGDEGQLQSVPLITKEQEEAAKSPDAQITGGGF